jgi:hypothetical protein
MRILYVAPAVLFVALTACERKPEATQVPPPAATGMMGGGPQMTMQGTQEMAMMGAQLDSLGAMTPAQMIAMMPAHQALTTQMMSSMGSVMQGMNMQLDSGWGALSDSVKQDLTAMPGLSDGALQSRMQSHIGRMRRMMTMYQGMTHR